MSAQEGQEPQTRTCQHIKADLILLHAPSVYDFRERDDTLFAYLSDSDSVNVTSIYEMYPLGFFAIKQRLQEEGFRVEIVNMASLMLKHPTIDVDGLLARLEAPVFGLDLHWMAHCHGSIEVAKRVKAIHPEALVIFGGISSTYYAEELIEYPAVDVVVRGYDTLEPVTMLMQAVKRGARDFADIPNLVYKAHAGEVVANPFSYKPAQNYNNVTTDWSYYRDAAEVPSSPKLIMTLPNTGCAYDCPFCGGSRYATRNIMGITKTLVTKDTRRVSDELRTMGDAAGATAIYALQCYSESRSRMYEFLDAVRETGYKSLFIEQFNLPDHSMLERMARSSSVQLMLSPQSHDPVISKLAGRGTYSMAEMEAWIPRALDAGIAGIMIWFFIGMPLQTPESVSDSISYAISLLERFGHQGVLPLICPMVPFLDPGSRFFEEPHKHGYRIFHRTLEQHRQAMVDPIWYRRLNYETNWLSRRQIQEVTYESIRRLVQAKADLYILPHGLARSIISVIDETKDLLGEIEHALRMDRNLPSSLRETMRSYNRKMLAYASDQITPLPRPFGGRWYDDFTVPAEMIAELTGVPALPA